MITVRAKWEKKLQYNFCLQYNWNVPSDFRTSACGISQHQNQPGIWTRSCIKTMLNIKLFNYVVIYLTMDGRALFVKCPLQYSIVLLAMNMSMLLKLYFFLRKIVLFMEPWKSFVSAMWFKTTESTPRKCPTGQCFRNWVYKLLWVVLKMCTLHSWCVFACVLLVLLPCFIYLI